MNSEPVSSSYCTTSNSIYLCILQNQGFQRDQPTFSLLSRFSSTKSASATCRVSWQYPAVCLARLTVKCEPTIRRTRPTITAQVAECQAPPLLYIRPFFCRRQRLRHAIPDAVQNGQVVGCRGAHVVDGVEYSCELCTVSDLRCCFEYA